MLFLLKRDDTREEIPDCENVIHRKDILVFLDAFDRPIRSLPAAEVFGYTVSRRVASALAEGKDSHDDRKSKSEQKSGRQRRTWPRRLARFH